MDRTKLEEIIASLDEKRPWELRELSTMISKRFDCFYPEKERWALEHFEAWKTPWYTLTIVSVKELETGERVQLVRHLCELLHCELSEGLKIMRSFPYEIVSRTGDYPLNCVEEYRPLKEALEALGFVLEEDYHFGQYA